MSIIKTTPLEEATGRVAELYAEDIEDQGFVASHTKVLALNPEALDASDALFGAVARPLGKRWYELVTLAAAQGVNSDHCRLAHGRRSLSLFSEPDLIRIAHDYRNADLSDAEVAMMEFAEKVSGDASAMTDADSQTLRDHGFSDYIIVNIALAAAARNFYSRAVQALAVDVDTPTDVSAELQDALLNPV